MKLQPENKGAGQLEYAPQISRLQVQVSDLGVEFSGLLKETKALRLELSDLRSNFSTLTKRVDTLQAEAVDARRELGQAAGLISQLTEHLSVVVQGIQAGETALAAVTRTLDQQQEDELRHQQAASEQLQRQLRDQQELRAILHQGRQQLCGQLESLSQKETQFQQQALATAGTLLEVLRKLDQQAHDRMEALGQAIQRLAQQEQAGLNHLAEGLQKVLDCERNLSQSFAGVNAVLGQLTQHSQEVLTEEQRARQAEQEAEAARLNTLGLKHLADGQYEAACQRLEQARALAPEAFEPGFNLAIAQFRQGNTDTAGELSEELSRNFPDRREIQWLKGLLCLATRNIAAAQHYLASVAESETQDESAQAAAGLAHLLNHDAESATKAFRRAAGSGRLGARFLRTLGFDPPAVP